MIEVSMAEILLFAWGMVATAMALKFRHEKEMVVRIAHALVTDEDARNTAVKAWREFEASTLKGE